MAGVMNDISIRIPHKSAKNYISIESKTKLNYKNLRLIAKPLFTHWTNVHFSNGHVFALQFQLHFLAL